MAPILVFHQSFRRPSEEGQYLPRLAQKDKDSEVQELQEWKTVWVQIAQIPRAAFLKQMGQILQGLQAKVIFLLWTRYEPLRRLCS